MKCAPFSMACGSAGGFVQGTRQSCHAGMVLASVETSVAGQSMLIVRRRYWSGDVEYSRESLH
jgi:hypothetical protein